MPIKSSTQLNFVKYKVYLLDFLKLVAVIWEI